MLLRIFSKTDKSFGLFPEERVPYQWLLGHEICVVCLSSSFFVISDTESQLWFPFSETVIFCSCCLSLSFLSCSWSEDLVSVYTPLILPEVSIVTQKLFGRFAIGSEDLNSVPMRLMPPRNVQFKLFTKQDVPTKQPSFPISVYDTALFLGLIHGDSSNFLHLV